MVKSLELNAVERVANQLQSLSTFRQMILELIQNADDAKSQTLEFHLSDDEMVIKND